MQTIQLLGGPEGRARSWPARASTSGPGVLAVAIADELEEFEVTHGRPPSVPTCASTTGWSTPAGPTAVRADGDGGSCSSVAGKR